ncbi:MAG: hypothetical protein WC139_00480 [Candidatus Kapaibacterium sp.]
MTYTILDSYLHPFADSAINILKSRFNLKKPIIEQSIDSNLAWRPTFYWNNKYEVFACEVLNQPYSQSVAEIYSDISSEGLPIRIIIAFPQNNGLTLDNYQTATNKLKKLGIGYLNVNSNGGGNLEYKGISQSLYISKLDLTGIKDFLRPKILTAFEIYRNEDQKHGVQELAQIVEAYIKNLATQAQAKGTYVNTRYNPSRFYNLKDLIDELTTQKVIDLGVLGKCRGFVYPRNDTSHPPKTLAEAKKIANKFRDNFIIGLDILNDLPARFKEEGYKFKELI